MRTLSVGEASETEIHSRPRWWATGIRLEEGCTYEFTATGTWVDWFEKYRCGPDGYPSDSPLLRMFERARAAPEQPWFALMGAIGGDQDTQFLIGPHRVYSAPTAGELTCQANDIPWMRWNNKECLILSVTKTA